MEEIRKNHIVELELRDGTKIEGIVFDYSKDRVSVLISFESLELAKKLNELDVLLVSVNTHIGVKKMFSHVIDELSKDNRITIENNESIETIQRRQFVRVLSNLTFKIEKEDESELDCYCVNISGGGIAFSVNDSHFEMGEKVAVYLPEEEFGKEIICPSQIIKYRKNVYVARFLNLTPAQEDRIVKYVFKLVAKK